MQCVYNSTGHDPDHLHFSDLIPCCLHRWLIFMSSSPLSNFRWRCRRGGQLWLFVTPRCRGLWGTGVTNDVILEV